MKTLIAAIVFMCIGDVCTEQHVEIEKKACTIGTLHGKVYGQDSKFGVRCQQQ
jgi:hypothetical protein